MKHKDREKYSKIIAAATKIFAKKGFFKAKVSEIKGGLVPKRFDNIV